MCCPVDGDFGRLKQSLENRGLSCDCILCRAENKYGKTRSSLMFEVTSFLESHPVKQITAPAVNYAIPADLVEEAENFEKSLKETYPARLFATYDGASNKINGMLPTMGMARIHEWLMIAYYRQPQRALGYAAKMLTDHGYRVTIKAANGILTLSGTNCILSTKAVRAIQYIELVCIRASNKPLAQAARVLAEEMYTTFMGSMAGYKDFEV
ncbi:unnamed protein product [Aureobasidium uvarum]|uniref:Uncharacterized protein n=1 Tax=Aureobasidium uvarum TaxID=2773716 RepID=A0A9N8PVM7_9PEZI|nr:unnamed protein product [Aureobasidium uvarum]